jgi:hypothetical protein
MNWAVVGRWVMLGGSLVLGILAGMIGFWIFEMKVPAAMQTGVLKAEARLYYLIAGLILGFVTYGWTRAAVAVADRAGASRARREAGSPKP